MKNGQIVWSCLPFFALFLFVGISCHHDLTTTPENPKLLGSIDYRNLSISFVDYDIIHIVNMVGDTFQSQDIFAIGVGSKDSTGYHEITKINSSQDQQSGVYTTTFNPTLRLDSTITDFPLTVRYYHPFSFDDVDTVVALYRYQYANANVLLTDTGAAASIRFLDIALSGDKLYLCPFPDVGLYELSIGSRQFRFVASHSKGKFLAADSQYVFCDSLGYINRFNLQQGSFDLTIDPFHDPGISYTGLSVYQGYLFATLLGRARIYKLSLAGDVIDSMNVSSVGNFLTISDNVIYRVGIGEPERIIRSDLGTGVDLSSFRPPAEFLSGIKIRDGVLYYVDNVKDMIGTVPVSDLTP